jgi:hypothetical protein
MNFITDDDPYNIKKYSDHELYLILDLVNQHPTDRELEAKIIQYIKKYSLIETEIGKKLTLFFSDMYDHFFETNKEEEGFNNQTPPTSKEEEENTTPIQEKEQPVILTNPQSVSKGKLNPLLNQTITRVICIDSKYRDNLNNKIQTLSTDFTFDLSEPLKDVVSLKLYSVQIPFTWYTIDSAFGSNFFILEPKPLSLINGNYTFPFSIPAGNYVNSTIFEKLNGSIDTVKQTFTDVSFGTTNFSYDSISALTTMTFDIKNIYNECNYSLFFGGTPDPYNIFKRTNSIANFLGYSFSTYSTSSIYSQYNNTKYNFNNDNSELYYVDSSNNSFQLIQYIATPTTLNSNAIPTVINKLIDKQLSPGSPLYVDISNSTQIIQTFTISFSNQIELNQTHTRTELLEDLNSQLKTNIYLDANHSGISLIGITDLSSSYNITDVSFVQLSVSLNRYTTSTIQDNKIVIEFPNENIPPKNNYRYIWRDIANNGTSCFNFNPDKQLFELNDIYGDTLPAITNYDISLNPYILLKCIREPYDFSLNNYTIKLANFQSYTLNNYIREINRGIFYANQEASSPSSNDLNLPNSQQSTISNNEIPSILNPITTWNTYCYQNQSDQHIYFQFDISRKFNENQYMIDVSNTIFQKILNIQAGNQDISLNNPFTCVFPVQANGYYVPYNIPLINILLKKEYTGSPINYVQYNVYMDASGDQSTNIQYFQTANEMIQTINQTFNEFTFYYKKNGIDFSGNPLQNTNLSQVEYIQSQYQSIFTIQVNVELTTDDYNAVFYDSSGGVYDASGYYNTSPWSSNGSWAKDLYMTNHSYSLTTNPISTITSSGYVIQDEIVLTSENNTFELNPLITANGLYSGSENKIIIDVSANYPYQQYELINDINKSLHANSLTNGSFMYIENNICRLRLNINKIYTANDYNLVLYDNINFVKCYVGSTSVRNVSWDSTLGWILGFRKYTTYDLSELNTDTTTNIISITGETTVALTLYNYFMIILDDYNQNHLNDGLVTIQKKDYGIYNPSFTKKSPNLCSNTENSNQISMTDEGISANYQNGNNKNNLTQNQIYANNNLLNAKQTNNNILQTSPGPYIKDIFGFIPLKTTGLTPGVSYIEFGGTLQSQERKYFGPVNIHRIRIQLLNDRGDIVNLNGQDWSFSLLCEQLYQSNNI